MIRGRGASLVATGLLTSACLDVGPGPTFRMTLRTAPGEELQSEEALIGLRAVRLLPCDDGPEQPAFPTTYGLTPPHNLRGLSVRPPIGPWCHLDLVHTGPLEATVATEDHRVTLALDVPSLALAGVSAPFAEPERVRRDDGNFRTAGVGVFVELGGPGWLTPTIDLDDGEHVDANHPLHDALVGALIDTAGAYADLDRDGRLSRDERANHRIGGFTRAD